VTLSSPTSITTAKIPRILLNRHGDVRDLRVERYAARWERRALVGRSERVQVPEASDPERRCAERNMYAPRAAFLHACNTYHHVHYVCVCERERAIQGSRTVTVLQSVAAMPNARRYPAA
jgi:hypothetical protein